MSGVVMVEQDGKIVYDVRPGSKIQAQSAQWAQGVDFMLGGEDQLPHPTLEAITGVGNTPAYRGSLVAVFKNFNTSAAGERIPVFRFTVASDATTALQDNVLEDFTFPSGLASGLYATGSTTETWVGNTIFSVVSRAGSPAVGDYLFDDAGGCDPPFWAWGLDGFRGVQFAGADSTPVAVNGSAAASLINSKVETFYLDWNTGWQYFHGGSTPDIVNTWFSGHGLTPPITEGDGVTGLPIPITSSAADIIQGIEIVEVEGALGEFECITRQPNVKLALTGNRNLARIHGSYWIDTDDGSMWRPSWIPSMEFSTQDPGSLSLQTIVERICKRGGLSTDEYDATAYADVEVLGYPISTQATASDCLTPLLASCFGFASDYDGKLHFRLFGQDAALTIDSDDILESSATEQANASSSLIVTTRA